MKTTLSEIIVKSNQKVLKVNQSFRLFDGHKKFDLSRLRKRKNQMPIVRFSPDSQSGLTKQQVEQRISQNLVNNTKIKTSKSYFSIFYKNIVTFFNMIWLFIAIVLCLVGAFDELTFVFVVLANTAIAIIQEIRAKVTVEKLSMQTLPHVRTIRDGQEVDVNSTSIVLDDVLVLSNGNQVPTDCVIMDGKVEVNESLLTGESSSVVKHVGDKLLSGSYLVAGTCKARVDKIGKDNYMFQIAAKAREFKAPQSNLFKDINRLIKYIGIAIIPIGLLNFWRSLSSSVDGLKGAVEDSTGLMTMMIPAGLFLLITISLAVGVVKLARKKTLVRDPYSIEMLARTNVLCLDKTGTITDGTMNVVEVKAFSRHRKDSIKQIMAKILFNQKSSNATSNALVKEFGKSSQVALNTIEFSSERKYSVTELEKDKIYFLGAATFIGCKLTAEQQSYLKDMQNKGLRVVALAEQSGQFEENMTGSEAKIIAMICLEEHIRKDAIETIRWFQENGVQIKIISGDDPATVSKIVSKVGIDESEKYVSLENVSLDEVEKMASQFTVFGRVTPEQKYTLVKALKKQGNVVSMTGDGVNDTLALKEADCSIAMADGSEIARNISNVVLLESTFSSLPSVVKEGRQVVNNVQYSAALYLMKTFFAISFSIITLIFGLPIPFSPKTSLFLEFFVIGIPSYILAFEPNSQKIRGNFIPQTLKRALPRALLLLVNILLITILYSRNIEISLSQSEFDTLSVMVLTYTGLLNLASLCIPITLMRGLAVGVSAVGLVLATVIAPNFVKMTNFSTSVIISFFVLMIVSTIITIIVKLNKKSLSKLKDKLIRLLQKTDE